MVTGFGVEAGKPLAQNKRIAKIAFTGETTTGRLDHAVCQSENIIPVARSSSAASRPTSSSPTSPPNEDDAFFDKALEGFTMFSR